MASPLPLPEFRDRIIQLYRDLGRDKGTIRQLDQVLREIASTLGPSATTADLTTASIARWMALYAPLRAAWTVLGLLGKLRAACSYAVEEGLLERQPGWKRLLPRRPRPGSGLHHSLEEIARLLGHLDRRGRDGDWTDRRLHALVATAALTGLRRNELLYLRPEDVLLDERIILVIPIEERDLKTPESEQPVPVPPELAEVLTSYLPIAVERSHPDRPWLWPGARARNAWHGGGPGRRPIDHLRRAGEAVGIRGVCWQSLRRSWATHAETAWGLTEPQIQRVLRHTSPVTSRQHYRCADRANLRAIADQVSYLGRPAG